MIFKSSLRPSEKAVMFIFLTVLSLFAANSTAAIEKPLCAKPPKEWQSFLRYEQDFNVPGRATLTAKETATQYLYVFEVLKTDGSHEVARINPRNELNAYPFYVAESWLEKRSLSEFIKLIGSEPIKVFCAQRVQGHYTVFVWDPDGNYLPFFAKPNSFPEVLKAARLFETVLKRINPAKIAFLPETLSTEITRNHPHWWDRLTKEPIEIASLRREVVPVPKSKNSNFQLLPLHGFLGSSLVDEAAEKNGLTKEEWLKKFYLPELADYFATLHFDLGFMHTSHTQNLLVEYDFESGRIQRFVIRDLHDLYPDYFKLILDQKLSVPDDLWERYVNGNGSDGNVKGLSAIELSMQGIHFGSYSIQSVISLSADKKEQIVYSEEFLKLYTAEVEKRLGKKIVFSEKANNAWNWLHYHDPSSPYLKSKYISAQRLLGAAYTEIVGSIHEFVANERSVFVNKDQIDMNSQDMLRAEFNKSHNRFYISGELAKRFKGKKASRSWSFVYRDKRVLAVDGSGSVVAIASDRLRKSLCDQFL